MCETRARLGRACSGRDRDGDGEEDDDDDEPKEEEEEDSVNEPVSEVEKLAGRGERGEIEVCR